VTEAEQVPSTEMVTATEELETGAEEVVEEVFCDAVVVDVSLELVDNVEDVLDVESTELLLLLDTPQDPKAG